VVLTDIPDIDADFEDRRRDEVYIYLQHRYGFLNSSRIATYTLLKDKSTIDLLARIFPTDVKLVIDLKEAILAYKKENDISELKSLKAKDMDAFIDFLPQELKQIEFLKYM
jgi:DNA polymerase III alpha subunit